MVGADSVTLLKFTKFPSYSKAMFIVVTPGTNLDASNCICPISSPFHITLVGVKNAALDVVKEGTCISALFIDEFNTINLVIILPSKLYVKLFVVFRENSC